VFPSGTVRATLMLASLALGGCETNCIDLACDAPSVEIRFEPAITQAGAYRLNLEADGTRSTCEVDFRPDAGWSGAAACGSLLLRGGVSRELATEIVGYSLPQARDVSIEVFRQGQLWAKHRFEPRYRGVELRGEGCGECVVATEIVELP
jgi:hypothetical protein